MRLRVPLLLCLTVITACSSKPDTAARPAVTQPSSAPSPKPADPSNPPASAAQAISGQEVDALLARWRDAQNQGDFAAYSALYAKRFAGVRRSGERTVRLPRDGWLKDRQRMFRSPHHVEISEQTVSLPAGMAKVRFTQVWTSSSYSDRGEKELLLVREGDALRIVYEELLHSQPAPTTSSNGYFVLHAGLPFAYVGDGVMGRPHGPDLKRIGTVATASIHAEDVPTEISEQIGRRVQALTRDGKSCGAKLGPLKYVIDVVTYEALGMEGDGEAPTMSEAEIAEGMWDLATHLRIGAQIVIDDGSACDPKQIVWVRTRDDVISVGTPIDHTPYNDAALAAVRAHRKHKAIQRAYDAFYERDAGTWEATIEPSVQAFRLGTRTLVSVAMPNPSCTAFSGALWAMFEVTSDAAKLKPLSFVDDAPSGIQLMFDEDGDGSPEMITRTWEVTEQRTSSGAVIHKMRSDIYICGC